MAGVQKKKLLHSWNFKEDNRTLEERLTDSIGNVKASLFLNASLRKEGLHLSYGDTDYMKGYALMEKVMGRGRLIEVDVASFRGDWDNGRNGRFIMMDDSTTYFDEGLVFNDSKQLWCFNDSTHGWDNGFQGLGKDAFSGKTVGIEITDEGVTTLYVDQIEIGKSNHRTAAKNVNLTIGSSSRAATGATVSAIRIYQVETEHFFTVRFLNKDGSDVISTQYVPKGASANPPVPPKYEGFIFIGWSASFQNVQSDITISPRYREIPPHPRLNFYETNPDGSSGNLKKSYYGVNACSIVKKLDGECTIDFMLMTKQTEGIISLNDRVEVDGLVFYVTEMKKNISGGVCYTSMSGDHISFLLNDTKYKVQSFEMTDTPRNIMQVLLSGTPFTVGNVDFINPVSLLINKEVTRRACVMQLIALLGGEIEYDGYTIGVRKHLGTETPIDIMKSSLVQDISYSHNVSENTTNYSLSLYQKGKLGLGDEIHIAFHPLSLDANSRIVGMEWNPFNYKEVQITVGQYLPTINDSLYEIVGEVSDIRENTAKYTIEFGEMIGNGTFYFTRSYRDRPYFHIHTSDGSVGNVELLKLNTQEFTPYIGAKLTGVSSTTSTLVVFYCTVPVETK